MSPTNIEWTDETWNPTTGCTKVSPACANCYIERTPPFRIKGRKFVKGHIPLELHENRLAAPLGWRKPRRVFVNSLSDLFHADVPDSFIDRVFAVMALCDDTRSQPRNHNFQVLTKRPARMQQYLTDPDTPYRIHSEVVYSVITGYRPRKGGCDWAPIAPWPLKNVWLGVSVENQHFADERIPLLLDTPAAVRFISAEPLLGPIDLSSPVLEADCDGYLDWVIVGGESGPRVRPTNPDWVRSIRDQCVAAGVPFFFKQWGGKTAKAGGRELDGRTWDEFPAAVTTITERKTRA